MWNIVAGIFLFFISFTIFFIFTQLFQKRVFFMLKIAQDLDNSFSAQYGQEEILGWTVAKRRTNRNHANKRPSPLKEPHSTQDVDEQKEHNINISLLSLRQCFAED